MATCFLDLPDEEDEAWRPFSQKPEHSLLSHREYYIRMRHGDGAFIAGHILLPPITIPGVQSGLCRALKAINDHHVLVAVKDILYHIDMKTRSVISQVPSTSSDWDLDMEDGVGAICGNSELKFWLEGETKFLDEIKIPSANSTYSLRMHRGNMGVGSNKGLHMYDVATRTQTDFVSWPAWVFDVSFSDNRVAFGGGAPNVQISDTRALHGSSQTYHGPGGNIIRCNLLTAENLLLVGTSSRHFQVIDLRTLKPIRGYLAPAMVYQCELLGTEHTLVASSTGHVECFNFNDSSAQGPIWQKELCNSTIYGFDRKGNVLYTGSSVGFEAWVAGESDADIPF